jgi:hypothetical protein
MNEGTMPMAVLGQVLRVWYIGTGPNAYGLGENGITRVQPSEGGHYITNGAERTVYDVQFNAADGKGAKIIEKCGTIFPRPPVGFRIKAHPVNAPVFGMLLNGVVYFQFIEQFHPEGCN